ncbi:MAG: 23S rRNA (adenine(2503)-C(2))-methyltransferase RlmN [Candidatus Eisenbacteria bacterium]|uniref:23S rRNA (Adenine(2503)-C(2))-methyltransferase RlmN n=1 Tax=Eiseniibacteriota bacterium TaxID=2212470 RepID=A0A538ST72_UNCEI|nr:MAG: 23S rRNA (adenine(2503)-C(2))-methyltransferase RlmN [Candidatus Eisenbacteria bacterium]
MNVKSETVANAKNAASSGGSEGRENLLGRSVPELEKLFHALGEKPYRGKQVGEWMYARGATAFDSMTNLPAALRAKLNEEFGIGVLRERSRRETPDRKTRKVGYEIPGGGIVESVYMSTPSRHTFCLSSQHGCAFACRFCATGRMGRGRNLTAAEIVEQAFRLRGELPPGRSEYNIVMMGMGEPLENYEAVVDVRFRLAVSLHAATDAQRSKLMPVNQRFPLEQLLRAIRHHVERTGRRVTFEYILLEELNDSVADAARLVRLVAQLPCKINLIPYNPIGPGKFKRPSPERIERFAEYLRPRVPAVTVRYSQGVEIGAACGQLAGETET